MYCTAFFMNLFYSECLFEKVLSINETKKKQKFLLEINKSTGTKTQNQSGLVSEYGKQHT